MGSIAYITDKKMMEYHRLHGNSVINFWKPSIKSIIDFKKGDMLFFLTKGTERGRKREKGILGYGHLRKQQNMGFTQMWNVYKTLSGYPDKEALRQAICKITKQEEVPELLSCMELENVVYFQYPIYLSEIGMEISNNIESFFYIDKENIQNTGKLLRLAASIGTDVWVNSTVATKEKNMQEDAILQLLENLSRRIDTGFYSEYEESKIRHYIQTLQDPDIRTIRNSKTEYWTKRDGKIMILLPCLLNFIDYESKIQYSIGHYQLFKVYINQSEYADQISIKLLFNQKVHRNWSYALSYLKIEYEERLVEED